MGSLLFVERIVEEDSGSCDNIQTKQANNKRQRISEEIKNRRLEKGDNPNDQNGSPQITSPPIKNGKYFAGNFAYRLDNNLLQGNNDGAEQNIKRISVIRSHKITSPPLKKKAPNGAVTDSNHLHLIITQNSLKLRPLNPDYAEDSEWIFGMQIQKRRAL